MRRYDGGSGGQCHRMNLLHVASTLPDNVSRAAAELETLATISILQVLAWVLFLARRLARSQALALTGETCVIP